MKKLITAVVILLVLVSGTFQVFKTSSSQVHHGAKQKSVVSSAVNSSNTGYTSVSSDSTSSTTNTSNLGHNSGASSTSSAVNSNAFEQTTSISKSNSSNEPTTPTEGQGHIVHNGQEAIDVIKDAYKSAGVDLNTFGFEVFSDNSHPNNFIVQSIVKSYRLDGGSGTADTYSVEPSGYYTLVN